MVFKTRRPAVAVPRFVLFAGGGILLVVLFSIIIIICSSSSSSSSSVNAFALMPPPLHSKISRTTRSSTASSLSSSSSAAASIQVARPLLALYSTATPATEALQNDTSKSAADADDDDDDDAAAKDSASLLNARSNDIVRKSLSNDSAKNDKDERQQKQQQQQQFHHDKQKEEESLQEWVQHAAVDATNAQQAIAAAVHAEHIYQNQIQTNAAAAAAAAAGDVNGLNLVLQAWLHCCIHLATARWQEQKHMTTPTNNAAAATTSGSLNYRHGHDDDDDSIKSKAKNNNMEWATSAVMQDVATAAIYTPKDAAERAQHWLMHPLATALLEKEDNTRAAADDDGTTTSRSIIPNADSFNIVMEAWAASRDPAAPQQVEYLLQQHPQPNLATYNAWMKAHAVAPPFSNRLAKVTQMYQFLLDHENSNLQPNLETINALLQTYARQANDELEKSLQYATAATKLFREQKTKGLQPNVQTYNYVMKCWARVATAGKQQLGPKYDLMQAPKQAEALFHEMKQLSDTTSAAGRGLLVYPDITSYVTLMKTWAKSGAYEAIPRCEALLNELCTASSSSDDDKDGKSDNRSRHIPPANTLACNALLSTYARSRRSDKATSCLQLLQRMRSSSMGDACAPNLVSYNTAIDACARTNTNKASLEQQTAALKIAFAVFQTIQKDKTITANSITYAGLLRVVAFLIPVGDPERNRIAKSIFEKAVKSGHVDASLLYKLQKATDFEVFQALVGDLWDGRHMHYDKIPSSWSRHVQ